MLICICKSAIYINRYNLYIRRKGDNTDNENVIVSHKFTRAATC